MHKPTRQQTRKYNYVCPTCGAYLDPGEKCDCAVRVAAVKNNEKSQTFGIMEGAKR